MLGTLFHLQHHGRHVQQVESFLSAGCGSFSPNHVVGIYEQFRKSGHLHHFQPRVSESLQKTHVSRALTLSDDIDRSRCFFCSSFLLNVYTSFFQVRDALKNNAGLIDTFRI